LVGWHVYPLLIQVDTVTSVVPPRPGTCAGRRGYGHASWRLISCLWYPAVFVAWMACVGCRIESDRHKGAEWHIQTGVKVFSDCQPHFSQQIHRDPIFQRMRHCQFIGSKQMHSRIFLATMFSVSFLFHKTCIDTNFFQISWNVIFCVFQTRCTDSFFFKFDVPSTFFVFFCFFVLFFSQTVHTINFLFQNLMHRQLDYFGLKKNA